jgi:hydroxymethylglutaryl-CoA lyase
MLERLPSFVRIHEVGPRDGLQNEARPISTTDKVAMIDALSETGLSRIEITSFVNPKWIPQLADATEVARAIRRRDGVAYSCLVPNRKGLD